MHYGCTEVLCDDREVSGAECVDGKCPLRILLASLDVMHRRGIDNQVGHEVAQLCRDGIDRRDLNVAMAKRKDGIAVG